MWLLLRCLSIGLLVVLHLLNHPVRADSPEEQRLEKALLLNYNLKIRPVKVETTVTQVTVFLNIAHVERVDEAEQTALVHGHLWASWTDEYLTWNRTANNITKIQLPSTKIWQPALALYNSARGNSWHLYMNGLPATVYYTGKVWSSGTFSFFVTCQFDFTDWPFDKQNCPIVIADWVYGLAQVNLSDPNTISEYAKPTIRLSYDPIDRKHKKHVGGWEVQDAWKKHCYWGPKGCKTDQPEGEADWYWSLLEFGIVIKRHLPYYGMTVLYPYFLTGGITLASFWIDKLSLNIACIVFNVGMQAVFGFNLIAQMPPGSGGAPKIVNLYFLSIALTALQIIIVIVLKFMEMNMPKSWYIQFALDITEIPRRMGVDRLFERKGLSFDPHELADSPVPGELGLILENGSGGGGCTASIGIGNALDDDPRFEALQSSTPSDAERSSDTTILISLPTNEEQLGEDVPTPAPHPKNKKPKSKPSSRLTNQLHHIKRYLFFVFLFIYVFAFLLCLFL